MSKKLCFIIALSLSTLVYAKHGPILSFGFKNVVDAVTVHDLTRDIKIKKSLKDTTINVGLGYHKTFDEFHMEVGIHYHQVKPFVYLNDHHHFGYKRSAVFGFYGLVGVPFKGCMVYARPQLIVSNKSLKMKVGQDTFKNKQHNQFNMLASVGLSTGITDKVSVFVEWCPRLLFKEQVEFGGYTTKVHKKEDHAHILIGLTYKV